MRRQYEKRRFPLPNQTQLWKKNMEVLAPRANEKEKENRIVNCTQPHAVQLFSLALL